jgi:hypothetical protein
MKNTETKKQVGNIKLIVNAIVLIFSILTLAVASFAWFTVNSTTVDRVVLNSGDSALTIDAFAYNQNYDTQSGNPVPNNYSKNNGAILSQHVSKGNVGSEGFFGVTFDQSNVLSFSALYEDEFSASENNFPHLFVELRYIKSSLDGFVKANVSDIAFSSSSALTPDSTGTSLVYQYRYVTKQNLAGQQTYSNVLKAAEADTSYQASAWKSLTTTGFSFFKNETDLSGYAYDASLSLEDQCYVPGFAYQYNDGSQNTYYYSKATLLEVRIDPLSWVSYYRAHPTAHANQLNFGVNFKINIDFSNELYRSTVAIPRVVSTPNNATLGINQSTTTSLRTYSFSSWSRCVVSSSDASVASATITALTNDTSTMTITAGSVQGSATLTITALLGGDANATERATTLVSVNVYSGPTLIIDPTILAITKGSIGTINTSSVLFSSTPTISATSSDPLIASPSVNNSVITVKGLSKGSATLTIIATSGSQTDTKTCNVTVTTLTKTVTSIAVTATPTTTEYAINTAFNSSGLIITATYDDDSTAAVTGYTLNPANGATLSTLGTQTITVTYGSVSTSFSVNVVENLVVLNSIAVTTQPSKVAYLLNETFTSTGLVVTGTYSDGTSAALTGYSLSIDGVTLNEGDVLSSEGSKSVSVSYEQQSTSFTISVTTPVTNHYVLATSMDDLIAGAKYIIVGNTTTAYNGAYYAMSATQNTINRIGIAVTQQTGNDGSKYIEPTDSSTVAIVTLGRSGTQWTFSTSAGYLAASSDSSNVLTSAATVTTTNGAAWTIDAVASSFPNKVTIKCQVANRTNIRYLQFNPQNYFSSYLNTQVPVCLYKQS